MNSSNKTSQLSDILGINHQTPEKSQTEFGSQPSSSIDETPISESKTQKVSWADNPKMRMLLAGGIVAIPTLVLISIYGSAFNLKTAVENSREAPEEVAAEEVEVELPASNQVDENLRGIIAIGQQYDAIAKIEKLEPKPTPEIKLEAKEPEKTVSVKVPDTNPQPISQPSQPTVRRNAVRPVISQVISQPKSAQIKTAPKTPEYDSMDDWFKLANSGSYGAVTTDRNDNNGILSIDQRLNAPKAQLVSNVEVTALPKKEIGLSNEEENFLKLLDYQEPTVETVKVKNKQVALAQQVEARLVTGINWVGGRQRVFVRLEEPLVDSEGNTQIDADSVLVYEVDNVNGGIVQGEIVSLIDAGEEIALPKGAISVLDKKGKMLAAKFKEIKHNGGSDALSFALGAAKQTRNLISQPDSSFTSIGQFGQSQSTNYDNKNYAGAVISGGATEALENRLNEAEHRRNSSPITSFWQIEADTKIILQTNYTFKY